MTSSPRSTPSLPPRAPTPAPQLHLRTDPRDYIDATWWPRTNSLAAELPDLITALQLRTGPVSRVVYDPSVWSPAASPLFVGDRRVRLDPYPFELADTVYVYGTNGSVMVLQAVQP
ncbi:DUF5994 family protein [Rhodococcus rhodochrous]|uniref:DUF5994 family protein n=1 Tax=Rhodococcus rhodochrous TaxID=1829 RepID=UPI001D00C33B|nr:DUF5994 family protein [Rhodococcus rhodochrous]